MGEKSHPLTAHLCLLVLILYFVADLGNISLMNSVLVYICSVYNKQLCIAVLQNYVGS